MLKICLGEPCGSGWAKTLAQCWCCGRRVQFGLGSSQKASWLKARRTWIVVDGRGEGKDKKEMARVEGKEPTRRRNESVNKQQTSSSKRSEST